MALLGRSMFAASALLLTAHVLGAQAAAKPACDVNDNAKGATARATLSVDLARQAGTSAGAMGHLKAAVKLLENPEKGEDATSKAYVLGSAMSLWLNQGVGMTPTRSTIGYASNGAATVDLVGQMDSLFTIVETAKPACAEFTSFWRAGQKAYLDIVNGAINAMNADKLDSAEYYAVTANRMYARSPYGTMVLGSVAAKRKETAKSIEYWTLAAAAADKDSTFRDVRRQMLANIGAAYMAQAGNVTGAAQTAAARQAASAYQQLIDVPGTTGQYMYAGRQQLQNALLMAGDTAAFVSTYQALIANPGQYEYQDLLNSAVAASRANKVADASKLFAGTLVPNPYSRDALFNLAVTQLTLEENEKVTPTVARLIALDPGNPENFKLAARAYLAMAKGKKGSAAAAYNDTTLTWFNRGNKLPVEVNFTEFSPGEKQVVVSGTVLDRRAEADLSEVAPAAPAARGARARPAAPAKKSYAPAPVTMVYEALDKSGAVVGTATVSTEALTPGKTGKFTVTIPAANAVGYRYKLGN